MKLVSESFLSQLIIKLAIMYIDSIGLNFQLSINNVLMSKSIVG